VTEIPLEDVLILSVVRIPFPGESDGSVERECRRLLLQACARANRVPLDGAIKVSWEDRAWQDERPCRVCAARAWTVLH
jgi:hypothetical protein